MTRALPARADELIGFGKSLGEALRWYLLIFYRPLQLGGVVRRPTPGTSLLEKMACLADGAQAQIFLIVLAMIALYEPGWSGCSLLLPYYKPLIVN